MKKCIADCTVTRCAHYGEHEEHKNGDCDDKCHCLEVGRETWCVDVPDDGKEAPSETVAKK